MLDTISLPLSQALPLLAISGSIGIIGAALALGIRHGIDWDHIAAITDITSTTAALEDDERWLVSEPGVMLTDESHHGLAQAEGDGPEGAVATEAPPRQAEFVHAHAAGHKHQHAFSDNGTQAGAIGAFVQKQKPALILGTAYALGHGSVVLVLGLLAILARGVLPDWIDPFMERVIGVTLLFLAVYLFYSVFRYFRGGGEFQMRSRWMLVFAAVRNASEAVRSKVLGRPHRHVHAAQRYGLRTATGIGVIHGIGAETGTQALVIATAVGANNETAGVLALAAFLVGLLISNSAVTVISTVGFVSSRQRQWIYVGAGLFAAVFSLVVGLAFVLRSTDVLPDLNQYTNWIGGPD